MNDIMVIIFFKIPDYSVMHTYIYMYIIFLFKKITGNHWCASDQFISGATRVL